MSFKHQYGQPGGCVRTYLSLLSSSPQYFVNSPRAIYRSFSSCMKAIENNMIVLMCWSRTKVQCSFARCKINNRSPLHPQLTGCLSTTKQKCLNAVLVTATTKPTNPTKPPIFQEPKDASVASYSTRNSQHHIPKLKGTIIWMISLCREAFRNDHLWHNKPSCSKTLIHSPSSQQQLGRTSFEAQDQPTVSQKTLKREKVGVPTLTDLTEGMVFQTVSAWSSPATPSLTRVKSSKMTQSSPVSQQF